MSSDHITSDMRRDLLWLADNVLHTGGIALCHIARGATIGVQTQWSYYVLTLLDPQTGEAIIRGEGGYFSKPERCFIVGASTDPNAIKPKSINVGESLVILSPSAGISLSTSPVRRIVIRPAPR